MRTGVAGFRSERLKQLRLALGLTQAALADMVGGASASVSKWESGQKIPEAAAFQRLCDVFCVSDNWLREPQVESQENTPFFFRSQVSTGQMARDIAEVRLRWLQEISYKLQVSLEFTAVNVPHVTENNCDLISDQEIELAASECRRAWDLGNSPIPDVVQVLENAGIVCARTSLGYLKMDGVSNWYGLDQRPYVLQVADKASGIRNRFDAVHELGHIVLHRSISKEQYTSRHALLESQADRFARAFLLPAERFAREFNWATLETFLDLKPRWKTSVGTMIKRCEDLEIINDTTAARLWKARAARGWIKGEPLDADYEFERPKLLGRGVQMLVENKVLSRQQVRRLLGLPLHILEGLCSLDDGYFDRTDKPQVADIRLRHKVSGGKRVSDAAKIIGFPARK